ncbi:MAG: SGNH/GDSL hydrolase family protein [Sphingomonadaceae bacterium]
MQLNVGGGGGGNVPVTPTPDLQESRYSGVISIGDSLIDAGNILGLARWYDGLPFSDAPDGTPLERLGYYEGRFSNGYTYADLITNKYTGEPSQPIFPFGYEDPVFGLRISPFADEPKDNNLNWAYGGAQIRGGGPIPNLDDQTDAMRDAADGEYDPGALFLVTMGGNDVRDLVRATGDPVTGERAYERLDRAAHEFLDEMLEMVTRGASNFLITGVPDVGIIPNYDLDGDRMLDGAPGGGLWIGGNAGTSEYQRSVLASEYSVYLDALIREYVVPLLRGTGVAVTYVPFASFLDSAGNVVEDGALELVLPTLAALNDLSLEDLTDNLLAHQELVFFDHVHPTAQVHALVGSLIHATLEGVTWEEIAPLDDATLDFSFTGAISESGEVDRFTVTLERGETYSFEMLGMSTLGTNGSLADPLLAILDPQGHAVTDLLDGSGDDAGLGFDARLVFNASRSGDYVIEASATGSLTGDYLVQGALVDAPRTPPPEPPPGAFLWIA